MTVLFTSDTHFGDPRVLRIDRRPFADLAEHDAALTARWNAAVAPEDTVWHLGDVALARSVDDVAARLAALNGTKHLIIGNNDGPATLAAAGWASVAHYAEIDAAAGPDPVERHLVLCYYAFRTCNRMGRGVLNLHGHSHGKLGRQTRQHDVGVDAWDFRPVTLDTLLAARPRRAPPAQTAGAAGAGRSTTPEP